MSLAGPGRQFFDLYRWPDGFVMSRPSEIAYRQHVYSPEPGVPWEVVESGLVIVFSLRDPDGRVVSSWALDSSEGDPLE